MRTSLVLDLTNGLVSAYDLLVVFACIVTVAGLLVGVFCGRLDLVILCGLPLFFVVPHALALLCIDRYAFPHPGF